MAEPLSGVLAQHKRWVEAARNAPRPAAKSPQQALDALRTDLQSRDARLSDGREVTSHADTAQWVLESAEATERGERAFDVDAPDGTRRLFYSGPAIDPATNEVETVTPGGTQAVHNRKVAEAITREVPDTTTLEQTTHGKLVDDLQLYDGGTQKYLNDLAKDNPGLQDAMDRVGASGKDNAAANATWGALSAQYARNTATAMDNDPSLETGVVTNQLYGGTIYCKDEHPQIADHADRIRYAAQVRTPGGDFQPTPGGVSDAELSAQGRGVAEAKAVLAAKSPAATPAPAVATPAVTTPAVTGPTATGPAAVPAVTGPAAVAPSTPALVAAHAGGPASGNSELANLQRLMHGGQAPATGAVAGASATAGQGSSERPSHLQGHNQGHNQGPKGRDDGPGTGR